MTGVAVCYVHDDRGGSHSFEASYRAMRNYDGTRQRVIRREITVALSKVDGLVASRNEIARQVVAAQDCDWALIVDRDMGFAPDALYQLLAVADPLQRPIVGALCFASWRTGRDGMGGWRTEPMPTLLRERDDLNGGPGLATLEVWPHDAVIPVAATGAAFLLVHRGVFEAVGSDWFSPTTDQSGRTVGEDIAFCLRARRLRYDLFVHTGVQTSHFKEQWVSAADYWRTYRPPPATQTVVVVADGEPSEAFRASLTASTGLAFLSHPDAPWLFLCDGDAVFAPGWLDHAQHVAKLFAAEVVQAGDGLLVKREFAAEVGDDPEKLIAVARERGVFQVAPGAVVGEA